MRPGGSTLGSRRRRPRSFDRSGPRPAEHNGDGEFVILDFVAFQLLWQSGDPSADCDANAEFNVLDFVCFQQLFVEGCP